MRFLALIPLLLLAACGAVIRKVDADAPYRVGVNFIRIGDGAPAADFDTADEVLDDLEALGAGGIRQLNGNDVSWFTVYVGGDPYDHASYDFDEADELIYTDRVYAVPTLFQHGDTQASANFSGDSTGMNFETHLYTPAGDDLSNLNTDPDILNAVYGYCMVVAQRYLLSHQHFEICNEVKEYQTGFSAEDYGHLLQVAHNAIHGVDPDLNVVLGGLAGTEDGVFANHLDWLRTVFDTLNRDGDGARIAVDVVNFHYYDGYSQLREAIIDLKDMLDEYDWEGPIWATELGRSSIAYTGAGGADQGPHEPGDSEDEQAADVFRLFSVAFGGGVELCNWHAYISGSESSADTWSGFGLRKKTSGAENKAYAAFQLFSDRLGNFSSCREISGGGSGKGERGESSIWAYLYLVPGEEIKSDGDLTLATMPSYQWVIWTDDDAGATYDLTAAIEDLGLFVPGSSVGLPSLSTVSAMSVVPDASGAQVTTSMDASALELTTDPILVQVPFGF